MAQASQGLPFDTWVLSPMSQVKVLSFTYIPRSFDNGQLYVKLSHQESEGKPFCCLASTHEFTSTPSASLHM